MNISTRSSKQNRVWNWNLLNFLLKPWNVFAQNWKDFFQICWLSRNKGEVYESRKQTLPPQVEAFPAFPDVRALWCQRSFSSRCQCLMILPALVGLCRKSKLDHRIGSLDNLAWGLFDTSSIGYWVHHFILKSGISIYILLQKRTRLEEEKITNDGGCILYSV